MLLRLLFAALVSALPERLIDLDAEPFVPEGWNVEEHQRTGKFEWDPAEVKLHLSPNQEGGKGIEGNKLRTALKAKSVYNANLLDYLLENQQLIPGEWKDKFVFFWGTIYRDSGNDVCVRCLCSHCGGWRWHYGWLAGDFSGHDPAAVRA